MTIEDIRGEEIVKICKQKEIIEQYKGILVNNGVPNDDVYRHLRMFLASEKLVGEDVALSSLFLVDNNLDITIKKDALESRIHKKYMRQAALNKI